MGDIPIDLICWDFGDTLVDERFMRIAPEGVPQWSEVYDEVLAERPEWVEGLDLGRGSLNDLVDPLAERLPMARSEICRHLRSVWDQIVWYPDAEEWLRRLAGSVLQAVVTVNPHEFSGIARACSLDLAVDVMVTSAEAETISKPRLAERARHLLGLPEGLDSSILIDNRTDNVDEFRTAGGHAIHYQPGADALNTLADLLDRHGWIWAGVPQPPARPDGPS